MYECSEQTENKLIGAWIEKHEHKSLSDHMFLSMEGGLGRPLMDGPVSGIERSIYSYSINRTAAKVIQDNIPFYQTAFAVFLGGAFFKLYGDSIPSHVNPVSAGACMIIGILMIGILLSMVKILHNEHLQRVMPDGKIFSQPGPLTASEILNRV